MMNTKPRLVEVPDDVEELASSVVAAAFEVHSELGPGLLESAYESCLVMELEARGLRVTRQTGVPLSYKGKSVDVGFRADIIVEDKLLIELKAVDALLPIHRAQVITYLKVLRLPVGLLINFNVPLIKDGIRRVLNAPKKMNNENGKAL